MIPILDLGIIQIPTYFLVISLSLSGLLIYLSHRVESMQVERKIAFNLALVLMASGFVGGRLFHVFYEEFKYYQQDPQQIFYFWNGGFVFLGGFLLASLTSWLYCKIKNLNFLEWADFYAPLLSLSHVLGRLGCILSGCCYGQFCELPWAMSSRHPTAIYLTVGELMIFCFLLIQENFQRKQKFSATGHLFFKWVFLHSLLRFCVEFYRDDFRGTNFSLPALGQLSISQVICFGLMIASLGFFIRSYLQLPKK